MQGGNQGTRVDFLPIFPLTFSSPRSNSEHNEQRVWVLINIGQRRRRRTSRFEETEDVPVIVPGPRLGPGWLRYEITFFSRFPATVNYPPWIRWRIVKLFNVSTSDRLRRITSPSPWNNLLSLPTLATLLSIPVSPLLCSFLVRACVRVCVSFLLFYFYFYIFFFFCFFLSSIGRY